MNEELKQRTLRVISEQLGRSLDEVKPEANLEADLGADSLDMIELSMAVEDDFGVNLAENVMASWHTVQDVLDTVALHGR